MPCKVLRGMEKKQKPKTQTPRIWNCSVRVTTRVQGALFTSECRPRFQLLLAVSKISNCLGYFALQDLGTIGLKPMRYTVVYRVCFLTYLEVLDGDDDKWWWFGVVAVRLSLSKL